jgi:hypothetical protein
LLLLSLGGAARADEGMWPFDAVPASAMAQAYGFTPPPALIDTLRSSSLRLGRGCTASFVSPHGLIMTSHHCVADCVALASTPQLNYVEQGFLAKRAANERSCANFEVDQLLRIEDVTASISGGLSRLAGQAREVALQGASEAAVRACDNDPSIRCEVVALYGGAVYDLYRYRRYTDLRLVFAPEFDIAQFGGDAALFNFPRYDFDIGFLRAYERGRPVSSPHYLRWSSNGSNVNDLVFAAANPGPTERDLTAAELVFERRYAYTARVPRLAEYRGILEEFQTRGPDAGREATGPLYAVQNALREESGRQQALEDPLFLTSREEQEAQLRRAVAANPDLQGTGSTWDDIGELQVLRAHLYPSYEAVAGEPFDTGLLGFARTLVRAAAERAKPGAERLPGFSDAELFDVRAKLALAQPIDADIEELALAFGLSKLRDTLGADDPLVQSFLGKESPEGLAHRLVSGTKLGDPAVREALFDGGQAAIDASTDPMIAYAKYVDEDIRTVVKDYQTRIALPTIAATERIAKARYAVYGKAVDPNGTFTLRLGYGVVAGFDANGTPVKPYTTFGGLYDGATASPPYALPPSWLDAKNSIDLSTPMNLATTVDSVGGDSGRPLVDRDAQIVGLLSGGNAYSLGAVFGYDPALDRAVALDSRAIILALDKIYHADRIVSELQRTRP